MHVMPGSTPQTLLYGLSVSCHCHHTALTTICKHGPGSGGGD